MARLRNTLDTGPLTPIAPVAAAPEIAELPSATTFQRTLAPRRKSHGDVALKALLPNNARRISWSTAPSSSAPQGRPESCSLTLGSGMLTNSQNPSASRPTSEVGGWINTSRASGRRLSEAEVKASSSTTGSQSLQPRRHSSAVHSSAESGKPLVIPQRGRRWSTGGARPHFLEPIQEPVGNSPRRRPSTNLKSEVPSSDVDPVGAASLSEQPRKPAPNYAEGFEALLSRHFESKAESTGDESQKAGFATLSRRPSGVNAGARELSPVKHSPKNKRTLRPGEVGFRDGTYAACILAQDNSDDDDDFGEETAEHASKAGKRRYSEQIRSSVKKVQQLIMVTSGKSDKMLVVNEKSKESDE